MAALLAGGILAGGLISAGGQLAGANAASDARNQALTDAKNQVNNLSTSAINGNFLGQFGTSNIFGTVPDAALYNPVAPIDFTKTQQQTINGNLLNLPGAEKLSAETNNFNIGQAQNRANQLVPGYQTNLNQMGKVTQDLLLGRLPYSDVLDVTSNRSSLGANLGVPGGTTNATLKDLGISQLNAEQTGANMFQTMLSGAQQVMPTSMLNDPSKMFYDPTTRAQLDLQQNSQNIEQAQLEQQSSQSANNLAASADPGAASLFNLSASLIPATLGVSTSGNLGGGIANASSALGSSVSQAALLSALKGGTGTMTGSSGTSFGSAGMPGMYSTSAGTTLGYDANGNLVPYSTQGYVNPNATF